MEHVRPRTLSFDDQMASLKQLTDSLSDVFWMCSVDRRQLFYLSPAFKRIWGRDPAEFYANPAAFVDTIHPDDRHLINRDLDDQLAGIFRAEYFEEFRILWPDGTVRWISSRSIPVRNEQGQVIQIAGISSDITDRKAAEAESKELKANLERLVAERSRELHESEQCLRTIIATEPDCVKIVAGDGTLLDMNPAGLAMVEATAVEHLRGQSVFNLIAPEYHAAYRAGLAAAIRGEVVSQSYEIVTNCGARRWVEQRSALLKTTVMKSNGANVDHHQIIAITRDITERVRVEKSLRLKAEILRQSHDAVIVTDMDSRITHWNEAAERDTGYSAEEVLGKSVWLLWPPDELPHYEEKIRTPLRQHGAHKVDVRVLRKNGETYWAHFSFCMLRDNAGQPVGCISSSIDITDRKQTELALINAERQVRNVLDSMSIYVGLFNRDGTIVEVNRAALEVGKRLREQVIGKSVWRTYWWSYSPQIQEQLQEMFRSAGAGEVVRRDAKARIAPDQFRHLDVMLCPLRDVEGQVVQIVGSSIDITERILAQEQMRVHREELTHVLRVACLGEMASGIAHELNQPLMAIASYAERLKLWSAKSPAENIQSMRETSQKLADQSVRAGDIVRRLRAMVRKSPARPISAGINSLVSTTIALVAPDARLAGVEIVFEAGDQLPRIQVDPVQIEQVILNLLRNAIDANEIDSAGAGTIVVKTEQIDQNRVCISVSDSGPGVPAENVEKIFEAFYSTKKKGLGMGLAISRSIIEAHHGSLGLDRDVARGALFRITLPIRWKG